MSVVLPLFSVNEGLCLFCAVSLLVYFKCTKTCLATTRDHPEPAGELTVLPRSIKWIKGMKLEGRKGGSRREAETGSTMTATNNDHDGSKP